VSFLVTLCVTALGKMQFKANYNSVFLHKSHVITKR